MNRGKTGDVRERFDRLTRMTRHYEFRRTVPSELRGELDQIVSRRLHGGGLAELRERFPKHPWNKTVRFIRRMEDEAKV